MRLVSRITCADVVEAAVVLGTSAALEAVAVHYGQPSWPLAAGLIPLGTAGLATWLSRQHSIGYAQRQRVVDQAVFHAAERRAQPVATGPGRAMAGAL